MRCQILWLCLIPSVIIVPGYAVGDKASGKRLRAVQPAPPQPEPLTFTIKASQQPVRRGKQFPVELKVVNTSNAIQTIDTTSCDWDDNWKSSSDHVMWQRWDCAKNIYQLIKLKPGEIYQKTLAMYVVAADSPTTAVRFKMGFTPIYGHRIYWSNAAQLSVRWD